MSYRHYFYKVPLTEIKTVENMEYNELCKYAQEHNAECELDEGEEWFNFNDKAFLNKEEIFEFGKLYWDDTAERIYNTGKPLFNKDDTQEMFADYVPYVVGKAGLLEAIKIYREKIINFYKDLLIDDEEYINNFFVDVRRKEIKSEEKMKNFVRNQIIEFDYCDFVNIDETKNWCVTSSWQYEYSIFNLVHILKTIDWDRDTILFYGW